MKQTVEHHTLGTCTLLGYRIVNGWGEPREQYLVARIAVKNDSPTWQDAIWFTPKIKVSVEFEG